MQLLKSICLGSWLASLALAKPPIGSIELGLLFPRNETYNTTEFIPIIFAVQNSSHIRDSLDLKLSYQVYPYGEKPALANWKSFDYHASSLDRYKLHVPQNDLLLKYDTFYNGTLNETTWEIVYNVQYVNCTPETKSGPPFTAVWDEKNATFKLDVHNAKYGRQHVRTFTTKANAKPADYMEISNNASCRSRHDQKTFAVQLDSVTPVPGGYRRWDTFSTCAVLGSAPDPNPCGSNISPETAMNITHDLGLDSRSMAGYSVQSISWLLISLSLLAVISTSS